MVFFLLLFLSLVSGEYSRSSKSGIQIRLAEKILKQVTQDLLAQIPFQMEYELDLPSEYKYSEEVLEYETFIKFYNIESDKIVIDYQ